MKRVDWAVALAITAFALALRLLGVRFGLPWFHHWDEGWVVENATHMLWTSDWEPSTYQYGAPLSQLMALGVRGLGWLHPKELVDPNDSVLLHLIGRVVAAVICASGAFGTYVAARFSTSGDRGAFVRAVYAGLAYATAAELVSHGRYAVTDGCLAALVAWTLACAALYLRHRSIRFAIALALVAGLTAAFKVTAATTLVIPFVVLQARMPVAPTLRARIIVAALVCLVMALVFFALNPHVLLHYEKASSDIMVRIRQYSNGGVPEFAVRAAGPDNLGAELYGIATQMFHRSIPASVAMCFLGVAGVVRAVRDRSVLVIVGALHAVVVVVVLASSRAYLLRNDLVVLPILCIGFGFALEWAHANMPTPGRVVQAAAFSVLFLGWPTRDALRMQSRVADTRMVALDWISAHAQSPSTSVCYTPAIDNDATGQRSKLRESLARPNVIVRADVDSAAAVLRSRPDFVVVVSHPDLFGRGDVWPFVEVSGYRTVTSVDANPYEYNFEINPTWMGRFNVLVLQRE